jgi:hypothetical protein
MNRLARLFAHPLSALPLAAVALSAIAVLVAQPRDAHAQAGVEAARLTQSSTENAPQPGPDWAKSDTPRPASRFRGQQSYGLMGYLHSEGYAGSVGAGLPYGNKPRFGTGSGGYDAPPPLPARKKSGAPGVVAGLVYQRADKLPVGGVTLNLISTETTFARETLVARTDSAGYYEFKAVEPGRWYLAVVADRLNPKWAPVRTGAIVTVAKKQQVAAPAIVVTPTSCTQGHTAWSDGYTLYDAPITVAPYDTTLLSVSGLANGVGDFSVCGAATDSVMVWMHLRDGRSLGRTTRLSPGAPIRVDFVADPLERMEGTVLHITTVANDGRPIPKARVTVVGRHFEQGARPALVFVREEATDRDGALDLHVPWGVYDILAVNGRDGQSGTVSRMVVNQDVKETQPLKIELRGTFTPAELAAKRELLLDRAETMLYVWTQ